MSSLEDFNFSGDDPGPSTDPTPDDPTSSYDDTNYKEPGQGEAFVGNEPTSFDSDGNPDLPEIQKSDVPPVEIERDPVTETQETNPVEIDIPAPVEEAINLLINLGLSDYVTGVLDENISEEEPGIELEQVQEVLGIDYRLDSVLGSIRSAKLIDTGIQPGTLGKEAGEEIRNFLDFFVFQDIGHTERIEKAFNSNFWHNLANLHQESTQESSDFGEDEGDIDEADGNTSSIADRGSDNELAYIDLEDWIGLGPVDSDNNLEYIDLNDWMGPNMQTLDEYIDINDYMGDPVQETFIEEFMYVSQEEI